MNQLLTAKNKIIVVSVAWFFVSAIMFLFLFKIMDGKNKATLDDMASNRQKLVTLQSQSESLRQAENDLNKISEVEPQPKDFFSIDINLVKEIQVLEAMDGKHNTKVTFSGVSGVVGPGQESAGTLTNMVYVPYSLSINGALADVVSQIEIFENLSFITKVDSIAFSSAGNGKVNAVMGSGFYIEQNTK